MSADTIGFTCVIRDGGEVWRFRNGKPTKRPIKGPLRLGEEVCCPSPFGYERAKVTQCGDKEARAESPGLIYPLRFANDDRGCWTCSVSLDKRAMGRFSLVL